MLMDQFTTVSQGQIDAILAPIQDEPRIENYVSMSERQWKAEYQEIFNYIEPLYKKLSDASEKLSQLKDLFKVIRSGNDLDRSYKVVFNSSEESQSDGISDSILQSFLDNNGFSIANLIKDARIAKDMIEAKLVRGNPDYCEVDLFNKEKQPVEC